MHARDGVAQHADRDEYEPIDGMKRKSSESLDVCFQVTGRQMATQLDIRIPGRFPPKSKGTDRKRARSVEMSPRIQTLWVHLVKRFYLRAAYFENQMGSLSRMTNKHAAVREAIDGYPTPTPP